MTQYNHRSASLWTNRYRGNSQGRRRGHKKRLLESMLENWEVRGFLLGGKWQKQVVKKWKIKLELSEERRGGKEKQEGRGKGIRDGRGTGGGFVVKGFFEKKYVRITEWRGMKVFLWCNRILGNSGIRRDDVMQKSNVGEIWDLVEMSCCHTSFKPT